MKQAITFNDWFWRLKELATEQGKINLVGAYHYHVESYANGISPQDELARLEEAE